MQNQLLKQQENFEKLKTNQIAQERIKNSRWRGFQTFSQNFVMTPTTALGYMKRSFQKDVYFGPTKKKLHCYLENWVLKKIRSIHIWYYLENKKKISFEKTVKTLSRFFDERDSLFHTRYKCLNIIKQENEGFVSYAGKANSL